MPKIFVSTFPFGLHGSGARELLESTGWDIRFNSLNRKLTSEELAEQAKDIDGLIAGTENLEKLILKNPNLKFISRVGIGLDNVPLNLCKGKQIRISYTPDAVTDAVSELTIGLMIDITRKITFTDREIRQQKWSRPVGKRLEHSTIGIIGFGRVGKKLVRLLSSFKPKEILVNDIFENKSLISKFQDEYSLNISFAEKEKIYSNSDIISLHLPLYSKTKNLINYESLKFFNTNSYLINTSRGEICNENELFECLKNNSIQGAAIDVFSEEPYKGKLTQLENVLLTEHIGSCSFDCRYKMEIQSAEEIIRFFKNQELLNEVPESEYNYQNDF